MELIVQKPQFNTAALVEGTAVRVKGVRDRNAFYSFEANCLVLKSGQLGITLAYVDKKGSYAVKDLPIQLVADGLVEIKIMGVLDHGKAD